MHCAKKFKSAFFISLFGIGMSLCSQTFAETVSSFTKEADGVLCKMSTGRQLKLQVYADNIIRVVYTKETKIPDAKGLMVVASPATTVSFDTNSSNATSIVLSTSKVKASITRANGAISFANAAGTVVCSEVADKRTLSPVTKAGVVGDSGTLCFDSPTDEGIYGLGNVSCPTPLWPGSYWGANCPDEKGVLNVRDLTIDMHQANWYDVIPFFTSTRGYGVLMNFACHATKRPPLNFTADYLLNNSWDYFFIYGPDFDKIISGYRTMTGKVQMLSKWAYGLWQSKNKYESQAEITTALTTYRAQKIPLDCIVQDWQWWKDSTAGWGSFVWNSKFPDPKGMVKTIHDNNCHFSISIWECFSTGTANYTKIQPYLLKNCNSNGGTYFDVFNATAAELYWNMVKTSCLDIGVDSWWMDAVEPECPRLTDQTCGLGPIDMYANAYSLASTKNIYENQRKVSEKRVVNLTRSFNAGQQRFGTIYWNGDLVDTGMIAVKTTVAGGLNACFAGNAYWCSDIGGFGGGWSVCDPNGGDYKSNKCQEIIRRWFQAGTFFPIFRIHGSRPTEIYNQTAETKAIEIEFTKLRYRLLPYIYSLAWKVTDENYTITRALPFDFPTDASVKNISDQFMFGPVFLVNPVVTAGAITRQLYLPQGTWYDFWTGEATTGGKNVTGQAPADKIPVYCRGGSILTMGPDLQWTSEKPADTIEVRVYPGADATFTLYEDEGDTYNYENDKFATIPMSWSDATKTLTIGARVGTFTGMLTNRVFNVVVVTAGHGVARAVTAKPDISAPYSGSAIAVKDGQLVPVGAQPTVTRSIRDNWKMSLSPKNTRLDYYVPSIAAGKRINIRLFDLNGALVNTLADKAVAMGSYTVDINKNKYLAQGVYLIRMTGAGFDKTMSFSVTK